MTANTGIQSALQASVARQNPALLGLLQPGRGVVGGLQQSQSSHSGAADFQASWRSILNSAGLKKEEPKPEEAGGENANEATEDSGEPIGGQVVSIEHRFFQDSDSCVSGAKEPSLHLYRAILSLADGHPAGAPAKVAAKNVGPSEAFAGGAPHAKTAKTEVNHRDDAQSTNKPGERRSTDFTETPALTSSHWAPDASSIANSAPLERVDLRNLSASTPSKVAVATDLNELHTGLGSSISVAKYAVATAPTRTPDVGTSSTPGQEDSWSPGQGLSKSTGPVETRLDPVLTDIPAKCDLSSAEGMPPLAQGRLTNAPSSSVPALSSTGTGVADEADSEFDGTHLDSVRPSAIETSEDGVSTTNVRDKVHNLQPGRMTELHSLPIEPTWANASIHGAAFAQHELAFGVTRDISLVQTATLSNSAGLATASGSQSNSVAQPARETFATLDAEPATANSTWVHAGSHQAEAGFQDPGIGWVGVRAQVSANGVHAAVVPSSIEAAQSLSCHLAGLNSHLAQHYASVEPVTLAVPERPPDSQSWIEEMGRGAGQGAAHDEHSSDQSKSNSNLASGSTTHFAESESAMGRLVEVPRFVSSESRYISVIA